MHVVNYIPDTSAPLSGRLTGGWIVPNAHSLQTCNGAQIHVLLVQKTRKYYYKKASVYVV